MSTQSEIEKFEKERDDAEQRARALNDHLDNLYLLRSKEAFGIEPGLKVRGQSGKEGICIRVRPDSWGKHKPWIYVSPIKKDGEKSKREICFYSDWEIVRD